jgi:hypothetical protein
MGDPAVMDQGTCGEKLELIAMWLELHGRVGKTNALFDKVCAEIIPKKARGRVHDSAQKNIRNWFSGQAQPSRPNTAALGRAIQTIAQGLNRQFDERWLQLPINELAEKIGVDRTRLTTRHPERSFANGAPIFKFDFVIPQDRMARIREKYSGTYFIYRCSSRISISEVVRCVLRIGPFEENLIHAQLITGGINGVGYSIPTPRYLSTLLVFGRGGDNLSTEAIYIRRNSRTQRMFIAVWTRAAASMADAYRAILLRKPALDQFEWTSKELQTYCRDFLPGSNVHKRLSPLLSRNSVAAGSENESNLTMDRYEFMRVLNDFDDDER